MRAYELERLVIDQAGSESLYHEFLRVPALSMGLYVLPAGSVDPQHPHDEDEVYYVTQGQAMIMVDGEDRVVQAGSIVYVASQIEHRFHTIEEDLHVLVFFAPEEGSGK